MLARNLTTTYILVLALSSFC